MRKGANCDMRFRHKLNMLEPGIAMLKAVGVLLLAGGALSGIVKVFVTDWLATSVQWMPFITQTTVWLTAPVLVVGAMLLSAVASAVSLRRYLKV